MPFVQTTDSRGRAYKAGAVLMALLIIAGAGLIWLVARERAEPPYVEGPSGVPLADISKAVARVAPAVARIDTTVGGDTRGILRGLFGGSPGDIFPRHGQGSGIVINGRRGYVLTNAHVVRGTREVQVTLPGGRRFRGTLLGADPVTDIAVVQIRGKHLPEAKLGSSDRLPVGSWVIAVGNPLGLANTVTAGVLSAKGRTFVSESGMAVTDLLQTDAAINRGNSGGALIDLQGQVVGMPTVIVPFAQGIGFAVAIDTAKDVLPQLVREGRVPHAWLGINYTTAPDGSGAIIEQVVTGTPAARGGLRAGDVIVALDGVKTKAAGDVARAIRGKRPGEKLRITLRRGRQAREITVRLAEASHAG